MDDSQKDYLNKYMRENDVEDTTNKIRKERQSNQLKIDIKKLMELRSLYKSDQLFISECEKKCRFLKTNQPKLYEKLTTNINKNTISITNDMINLLTQIENGIIDQNEASYSFGMLCKKLYIDPVIIDKKEIKDINWKEYKKMQKE
tara:strand:- start:2366 stop:2803 length:438 start_codon:yes stop_codon:yes gene_type:complete